MQRTDHPVLIAAILTLASPRSDGFEVFGLAHPVCIIADPETGNYFVANINGAPSARDNNGFITKLDPHGKVLAREFIAATKAVPLHAPKGLAVIGKALYVLDIDRLKAYDTEQGGLLYDVDMTPFKATFLNDLTRDAEGNLYLSDSGSGFVAKVEPARGHRVTILASGSQLAGANGLSVHPRSGRLVVVTWGTGRVLEVTETGKVRPWIDRTFGKLDGADFDRDGVLYVSAYEEGKVYRIDTDGKVSVFQKGLLTPADINIDRSRGLLLIPSFAGDSIRSVPLGE